jgi:hypothetical protein
MSSTRAQTWLAGLIVVTGCAGELESPERFADCPPGYVEQRFQESCGPECHNAIDQEAMLDLVTPGVGGRVRTTVSATEDCGGRALIDPTGGPHLFMEKLTTPTCGTRMPFGEAALPPEDLECVRRWIEEVSAGGSP